MLLLAVVISLFVLRWLERSTSHLTQPAGPKDNELSEFVSAIQGLRAAWASTERF